MVDLGFNQQACEDDIARECNDVARIKKKHAIVVLEFRTGANLAPSLDHNASTSPKYQPGAAGPQSAQFKKEAAPPVMGGTASGVETTDLSGGGQAAISRGAGESSLALPMSVTPSASSSSCSAGAGSAGSAKRITSGTQAIARSRTSASEM